LFHHRTKRMRVLQLLKIPYSALPDFFLLKIPLHLKILHNIIFSKNNAPYQDCTPTQPLQHHSTPRIPSPKSTLRTTSPSPQNPPPTQPLQHHSPPCIPSPKSTPQTTPSPQNPPTIQPLQHHSPPRVPSTKSLPQTTRPCPQNPPKAPKKHDADVNKPSTVLSSAIGKCFGNLQNYQHN
jgi:hypothetical protein